MEELKRRGRPAFFLSTPSTKDKVPPDLYDGTADMRHMLALSDPPIRRRTRQRAHDLAVRLKQILPPDTDGGADEWIYTGLLAQQAAIWWSGRAGAILTDSDIEDYRKGMILGSQRAGVRSLMLQHGLLGSHHFPVHASLFGVWGGLERDEARRHGTPAEKLLPLGCPRWDELPMLRRLPQDPSLRRRLGGEPGRTLVLILSNSHGAPTHPELFAPFFAGVHRLVEAEFDVAVRLHPAEPGLRYYHDHLPAAILSKLKVTSPGVTLHDACRSADVVYHSFSTAALEALLLGVPVLWPRTKGEVSMRYIPDHGGGLWVAEGDLVSLCRALSQAGTEREDALRMQDAFIGRYFSNLGRATAAAADELERLAEDG